MRLYQEIGGESASWQNVSRVIKAGTVLLSLKDTPLEIEFDNVWVYADPLLQKVFYNIVENALRHAGPISGIWFSCHKNNGDISIFCEDDGIGIPEEEKERVFKREFYKNTGLGLFLSREILSITGMTISEVGKPGKGARFEIRIPEGVWKIENDGFRTVPPAIEEL